MSSPGTVLQVLRAEMRAADITYRKLADALQMSESSIKRMFSGGDMSLSRVAQICQVVGVAMEDVLRQAADASARPDQLTLPQEQALVADPKLLLVAISCLGHWTLTQIVETYELTEAECISRLAQLDRLGLIELKPLNRYRLRVSIAFQWLPHGPVQQFFRTQVLEDYFSGGFDGGGEALLCVHARLSDPKAAEMVNKMRQLAAELARLHHEDQRLALNERDGFTLVMGLRCWEARVLTAYRRKPAPGAAPAPAAPGSTPGSIVRRIAG